MADALMEPVAAAREERIRQLEALVAALRLENQRLREQLETTEAREWQRYPLGRL